MTNVSKASIIARPVDLLVRIRCTSQSRSLGLRISSIAVPSMVGKNTTPVTTRVQNHAGPGPNSQPPTSNASSDGDTRLRRRLSKIFHTDKAESGFGSRFGFDPLGAFNP